MYLFPAFNQNCIIFTHDVHFPLPGADKGTRKKGEKRWLLSFFAWERYGFLGLASRQKGAEPQSSGAISFCCSGDRDNNSIASSAGMFIFCIRLRMLASSVSFRPSFRSSFIFISSVI